MKSLPIIAVTAFFTPVVVAFAIFAPTSLQESRQINEAKVQELKVRVAKVQELKVRAAKAQEIELIVRAAKVRAAKAKEAVLQIERMIRESQQESVRLERQIQDSYAQEAKWERERAAKVQVVRNKYIQVLHRISSLKKQAKDQDLREELKRQEFRRNRNAYPEAERDRLERHWKNQLDTMTARMRKLTDQRYDLKRQAARLGITLN